MPREPDFADDDSKAAWLSDYRPSDDRAAASEILVASGTLAVPPGTPTGDFSVMEAMFRSTLWPPVFPGRKRWRRKLRWNAGRTELRYWIYDVPSPCATERR